MSEFGLADRHAAEFTAKLIVVIPGAALIAAASPSLSAHPVHCRIGAIRHRQQSALHSVGAEGSPASEIQLAPPRLSSFELNFKKKPFGSSVLRIFTRRSEGFCIEERATVTGDNRRYRLAFAEEMKTEHDDPNSGLPISCAQAAAQFDRILDRQKKLATSAIETLQRRLAAQRGGAQAVELF